MLAPAELLSYIDANTDAFVAWLSEAVSITSISGDPAFQPKLRVVASRGAKPSSYGHFDVQPAAKSDEWDTEPFVLVEEKDGRLVEGTPLPVNLVFCFEGMEENGSEGLDELVEREKDGWVPECELDNYWRNTRTLALTYGLRGLVYFKITVSGPGHDCTLSSPQATTDLITLMSRLVASAGNILVPGVDDMCKLDYSVQDVEDAAGCKILLSASKVVSGGGASKKGRAHDVGVDSRGQEAGTWIWERDMRAGAFFASRSGLAGAFLCFGDAQAHDCVRAPGRPSRESLADIYVAYWIWVVSTTDTDAMGQVWLLLCGARLCVCAGNADAGEGIRLGFDLNVGADVCFEEREYAGVRIFQAMIHFSLSSPNSPPSPSSLRRAQPKISSLDPPSLPSLDFVFIFHITSSPASPSCDTTP
ncbi:hypothetical protein B0H19DRAFT_1267025 [Mycena capillaripes]|nr:hypothetical protein B0H19DRAFT_1267025 [Mycena capillaripes]